MTALQAILFDVDDTLFSTTDFAALARRRAVQAMIRHGLQATEEQAMSELAEVLKEFSSNYDHHFDKLLIRLSGQARLPARRAMTVTAGVVAYHNTKFEALAPFPDVKPLLKGIQNAGVRLGVITHGWTSKQSEKLIRLGLSIGYFPPENIFISDTVGINKPNPKLYAHALEAMGLEHCPGEVMYVGDNPTNDIAPPKGLGMKTVWCKRASKVASTDIRADHEVETLADLAPILRDVYQLAL